MEKMNFLSESPFCRIATKAMVAVLFAIFLGGASFAQGTNGSVKGTVTDETNAPVAGVTVSIKGTAIATTTNADGTYSIPVKGPGDVLVFSMVGTPSQE